ncbi:uncharacterized protein BDZ99DRAFT_523558 [Mytilinidion resinicola]|uniref:F-box domain-containing protein n=1 Tax=Mytilinidion resinicola TaxID=574789 RepID=A0A6A6YEQ6_9PEZI|nr:uncharacterized protein BDZ99DRAFT_523558 [Mytilinidion resinicola]KAF2807013.1 hypothetical protein BDZ99DRAFT_523558 [Mytilinidion resinicola]
MILSDLPDDILIPILQNIRLNDLFALRLTSQSTLAVIDTYITAIAPHVAHHTFPNCPLLLTHSPTHPTPSLRWLKSLIPAQLAAIALDKDKLRRYPYLTAGFPYGIPSTAPHALARHWRRRVANGWRVLQRLHLVSARAYAAPPHAAGRLSKLGAAVRCNRLGMLVACPYQACKEHAASRVFSGAYWKGSDAYLDAVRRREEVVLKERVRLVKGLADAECEDYVFVWRLLLWVFRPYGRPGEEEGKGMEGEEEEGEEGGHNWQAEISNISNGCSWLNWWVLHAGADVFWRQWWSERRPNLVRDEVWRDWRERTHHQVELEKEYVAKFEFAVRKRCLSVERRTRLEQEEWRESQNGRGRVVKTISLDCISWEYDQNPIIYRPPKDFPWYPSGTWLWLDRYVWMIVPHGTPMVVEPVGLYGHLESPLLNDGHGRGPGRVEDPLIRIPYLVYLDTKEAAEVWGSSGSGTGHSLQWIF